MKRSPAWGFCLIIGCAAVLSGCASTPTSQPATASLTSVEPAAEAGIMGTFSKAGRAVRSQFDSMGSAFRSGVDKAKTTVAGTSSTTVPADDPTSLQNMPKSLGPEVFVANGQMWEASGRLDKAEENYQKALGIEPKNGPALASMARLHERRGNKEQAIAAYEQAIAATPNDATLYNDEAMILSGLGRHDEAAAKMRQAIAIHPSNKRFANNLAIVLMNAKQPEQAMAALQQVHRPADAHYNMAYLYAKEQNVALAKQHAMQALQIDPNLAQARQLLDKLGGPQLAQATAGAIQVANNTLQTVNHVMAAPSAPPAPTSPATTSPAPATAPAAPLMPPPTTR